VCSVRKMPRLGDRIEFKPTILESGLGPDRQLLPRKLQGTVVYIHPKHRFFVVAAQTAIGEIRETIYKI